MNLLEGKLWNDFAKNEFHTSPSMNYDLIGKPETDMKLRLKSINWLHSLSYIKKDTRNILSTIINSGIWIKKRDFKIRFKEFD
ncbi:unnamed protein product [Blepharisma stoltei]|uniref:Uncharacterized protein n=1 Tax=Blepharisma stoltei TaxID=1481888 RepID=A0AAU9JL67_9CILI|nr:unnamed protein product [Blepharisma stoltei]